MFKKMGADGEGDDAKLSFEVTSHTEYLCGPFALGMMQLYDTATQICPRRLSA